MQKDHAIAALRSETFVKERSLNKSIVDLSCKLDSLENKYLLLEGDRERDVHQASRSARQDERQKYALKMHAHSHVVRGLRSKLADATAKQIVRLL